MAGRALLCAVLIFTTAGVASAASAGVVTRSVEMAGSIEVSGKALEHKGASGYYQLGVTYAAESQKMLGDALLIYAEPSHTLLFAHVNSSRRVLDKTGEEEPISERALSMDYGPSGRFRHALTLPYQPQALGDTRIEVVMRSRGGDVLLASGKVNVRDFQYSTTFTAVMLPDGGLDYVGGTHCCRGPNCAQMCVSCSGAFFDCDLITCTINCEYF
jgi:hypothetical protein